MEFKKLDKVRVRTHGGRIGTIKKVFYEMVDSKEKNIVISCLKIDLMLWYILRNIIYCNETR